MNLTEFHDEYWWPLACSKLRECTLIGYESKWRLHIQPALGSMELEDITPRILDAWFDKIEGNKAWGIWAVARIIIRTAYKYEFIDKDPTMRVLNAPKRPKSTQPTLTKAEVAKLLDGFKWHELEAWLICMVTMGLRREEGCALTWDDIDLDTGAVNINKGAQYIKGRTVINPPKTRNGYRTCWLNGKYLERIREIASKGNVTPYNPSRTARVYRKHCIDNNLPYVPPKNLRTTFGTLAVQEGWDVARISKWMGHYDPSVTMSNYMHPREEETFGLSTIFDEPEGIINKITKWFKK